MENTKIDIGEILVFIADIGYGPTCTTLPILVLLKKILPNIRLVAFGGELVCEQCIDSKIFDKVHKLDLKNKEQIKFYFVQYNKCKYVISNSNLESVQVGLEYKKTIIFIDILAFLHSKWPGYLKNCKLLVVQDFFTVDKVISKVLSKYTNIMHVGSLSSIIRSSKSNDSVIISLGGGTFSHHMTSDYQGKYFNIVNAIVLGTTSALNKYKIAFEICAGGILAQGISTSKEFIIKTFPHHVFLEKLRHAKMAFLAPGLTGINECRQLDCPIYLLLPLNYSQVFQADYAINKWGMSGITWESLINIKPFDCHANEDQNNHQLWQEIMELKEEFIKDYIYKKICSFIINSENKSQSAIPFRSGVNEVCMKIIEVLGKGN
jgi:hypothetical protein